ncbi:response regulator [Achromobacter mucicolens]|uniref:response regulator transcription factor n=1 Tax=Achromobacter mucicolens TaxID=1389922 RepID=UPI00244D39FE|nr:response regulator [Achromobacter mucicolens]MDH0092731.1 response regulator [Achromobacter mucicolens]
MDDDSTTADLTAECLMMDQSVSVRTAGDGATALRTMNEFAPDVVLLDVELPDASGLELAPQLKNAGQGRTRIIIFSGSVPKSDTAPLPYGVDVWLTKPAHLDELLDCIFRPTGARKSP